MGDFNVDGQRVTGQHYQTLMRLLDGPNDLWHSNDKPTPGYSFDDRNSFAAESEPLAIDSSLRHQSGERLDYFFHRTDPTDRWHALYPAVDVVNWQPSLGRDLSDHYGLRATQAGLLERAVDETTPIDAVTVRLARFRCLQITGGIGGVGHISKDPDEVRFRMTVLTAAGELKHSSFSPTFFGVSSGDEHEIQTPITLSTSDPGEFLNVGVEGEEVDDVTANVQLGPGKLRLSRRVLQQWKRQTVTVAPSLLVGDGGSYAVFVTVTVD